MFGSGKRSSPEISLGSRVSLVLASSLALHEVISIRSSIGFAMLLNALTTTDVGSR